MFNVLLESLYERTERVASRRLVTRGGEFTINPGIRWAHNFRNGL